MKARNREDRQIDKCRVLDAFIAGGQEIFNPRGQW